MTTTIVHTPSGLYRTDGYDLINIKYLFTQTNN